MDQRQDNSAVSLLRVQGSWQSLSALALLETCQYLPARFHLFTVCSEWILHTLPMQGPCLICKTVCPAQYSVTGSCTVCCSCSSLDEAFYFPDKLIASMRSSVQGSAEGASVCSAWLFVLACFRNTDLETVSDASARAIQIANDYMRAVADRVKSLVLRVYEVCLWSQHARMPLCQNLSGGLQYPSMT